MSDKVTDVSDCVTDVYDLVTDMSDKVTDMSDVSDCVTDVYDLVTDMSDCVTEPPSQCLTMQVFSVSPKVHTTRQKALGAFNVGHTQVVSEY